MIVIYTDYALSLRNFVAGLWKLYPRHIGIKKKRYAHLVS